MKYQIEFKIDHLVTAITLRHILFGFGSHQVKGSVESDEVSYLRCDDLADLRMTLKTLARFEVSDVVINTIED